MIAPEILATALHRFRSHPLQTWLTLAGLVVGTAAIIIIVSLGLSGRAFVMSQIEAVGSHVLWATYDGTVSGGASRAVDDSINERDVQAVAARSDLFAGVTPLVEMRGSVPVESREITIAVLGTTPNYLDVRRNVHLLRGRFLDSDDLLQRSKVCVVSKDLYEKISGAGETPRTLRTMGATFIIVGEFENPVDTMGQGEVRRDAIFVPITVAWFFTDRHRVDTLFAEVRDFDAIPMAQSVVEATLRERHHSGAVFDVENMATVVHLARSISAGLILIFILAASVSVIVGGVGIMNILLASVEQRTREIGIRMSLGATRRDILLQFLFEAFILGAAGALLGVVCGLSLPLILAPFVKQVAVQVSPLSALLAFLFSAGVAVIFGVTPALRASRLQPIEALHHE